MNTEFYTVTSFVELCFRYLVLGVVQGLTEFLPISSTAHLRVVPTLLGWGDPGVAVTAVIQLGSIFAVIGYFRRDLLLVFKGFSLGIRNGQWLSPEARLGISISLGTVPILIAGLAIKCFWPGYENSFLRSIPSIAIVSIVMSILLAWVEIVGSRKKTLIDVQASDGLVVGIGQVFALIPGASRSGVTLTTALSNGWRRKDAARFSFLLGIPAISIAGLVELKDVLEGSSELGLFPLILGIFSAMVMSWISIHWLIKYLQSHSTWIFVAYRMFFGIFLLALWARF